MDFLFQMAIVIQIIGIIVGVRSIVYGIQGVTKSEIKYFFFFPRTTKFSGKTAVVFGYFLIFSGLIIIFLPSLLFLILKK